MKSLIDFGSRSKSDKETKGISCSLFVTRRRLLIEQYLIPINNPQYTVLCEGKDVATCTIELDFYHSSKYSSKIDIL